MTRLFTDNIALGAIFEFPNPLPRKKLEEWLNEHDFTVSSPQKVKIGEGDFPVGEAVKSEMAEKDDKIVLYNPNANLPGFDNCSFITIRDEKGRFEEVLEEAETFWSGFQDLEIINEFEIWELTLEGIVKISEDNNITRFLKNSDALNKVEETLGEQVKGSIVGFQSDREPTQEGWFKIFIESFSLRNPYQWKIRYVQKFESKDEVDEGELIDKVKSIIDSTKGEE